jgi:hypothetical protein
VGETAAPEKLLELVASDACNQVPHEDRARGILGLGVEGLHHVRGQVVLRHHANSWNAPKSRDRPAQPSSNLGSEALLLLHAEES